MSSTAVCSTRAGAVTRAAPATAKATNEAATTAPAATRRARGDEARRVTARPISTTAAAASVMMPSGRSMP